MLNITRITYSREPSSLTGMGVINPRGVAAFELAGGVIIPGVCVGGSTSGPFPMRQADGRLWNTLVNPWDSTGRKPSRIWGTMNKALNDPVRACEKYGFTQVIVDFPCSAPSCRLSDVKVEPVSGNPAFCAIVSCKLDDCFTTDRLALHHTPGGGWDISGIPSMNPRVYTGRNLIPVFTDASPVRMRLLEEVLNLYSSSEQAEEPGLEEDDGQDGPCPF